MLKNKGRGSIDFSSYVKQHTHGFTGRIWVFEAVNNWLAQSDGSRFFVLTGDPGSGKTAIASRLFQFAREKVLPPDALIYLRPDFLHAAYFCSARDSRWISPHIFAESLAFQLAGRFPAYAQALAAKSGDQRIVIRVEQRVRSVKGGQVVGVVIEKLDVSVASPESAFNHVVREPLEELFRNVFDQQVVILVDALDEALLYGEKQNIFSLLARAQYLPTAVRFIVTTRPEPEVLRSLRRFPAEEHALSSREGLIKSEGDVRQYVINTMISTYPTVATKLVPDLSSTNFADIIQAKSKGNFLYIRYLLKMLAIARHSSVRDEALSTLQKASAALINEGWYGIKVPHIILLADIAVEMASLAPWNALDLVKRMNEGAEKQRALKATLRAILQEESFLWESISLPLWALQDLVERLYQTDSGRRMRIEIFRALLGLLDPAQSMSMLDWLQTRDASLSLQLRGWYLSESDPDAALGFFAAAGLESIARRVVIVRSAARFPDRALELYHQGHEEPEVLIEAIGAIAQHDSIRARAIAETELWKDRLDRWQALAAVAGAVAKSDWQQALDIIRPISDDSLRSMALSRIATDLPQDLPPGDVDLAIARLTMEAGALPYPNDRLNVYESLLGFLQTRPLLPPSATAALIEAIGMGDSGVFLQLLPDLIRLVCKGDPRMPFRLEAERCTA